MTWDDHLEEHQHDYDFGNDTVDLMRQAYTAGLKAALQMIEDDEDGDIDFVVFKLERTIKDCE